MGGLEVEPELRGGSEEAGEAECGVGSDSAALVEDFADASGRQHGAGGELVGGGAHEEEEVFAEDLAGMGGNAADRPAVCGLGDRDADWVACGAGLSDSRQFQPRVVRRVSM